jgi:hypothetical protein
VVEVVQVVDVVVLEEVLQVEEEEEVLQVVVVEVQVVAVVDVVEGNCIIFKLPVPFIPKFYFLIVAVVDVAVDAVAAVVVEEAGKRIFVCRQPHDLIFLY